MSKRLPIIFGILFTILALWLLLTSYPPVRHLVSRLHNIGYDLQLRSRALTEQPPADSHVVIVDIDDESLKAVGRWPWPRKDLAKLTQALSEQGAVVIAFDIFFSEEQKNLAETVLTELKEKGSSTPAVETLLTEQLPTFNQDQIFADSLKTVDAILAYTFAYRKEVQNDLPPPIFKLNPQQINDFDLIKAKGYIGNIGVIQEAAKGGGFINIIPDEDGIIRRAPVLMEYQGGVYPSLALKAVLSFLGGEPKLIAKGYHGETELEGVAVGRRVIPTDSRGFALIPFIGRSYTFPYYSAVKVLNKKVPEDALLGKIVFVGSSATGLGDLQPTSIQNPYPGVEIQATLANGILENSFSSMPAWTLGAGLMTTGLLGLIAAFLFPYLGPRVLGLVIFTFPIIMFYINAWFWRQTGVVMSLLMPTMLVVGLAIFNILYGYLFESRRREQLKQIFGQYVPEKHINEMLKTHGDFSLKGEDREMSVLFADIQSFTTISEGMNAHDLVEMLNRYFTPMTEIIHKHMGTIDKYVGDQIIAFWGAPLRDKNHAFHALRTAIEMQSELNNIRDSKEMQHLPKIYMGAGINSGMMSVGDMGSRFRRNYTVIGDSVNLASRVEGLSRFYGVDIVVTENTQKDQPLIAFRQLDKVVVKGKHESVGIYEVLGMANAISDEVKQSLEEYNKALLAYYAKEWGEALKSLQALQSHFPDQKLYQIYIDRIRAYEKTPPPQDWDGVFTHKSK